MMETSGEVYANILMSLTAGLYNEIDLAIREYLQNSYDAIRSAREKGVPLQQDDYHVQVMITKDNKNITVTDNGIGMDDRVLREYTSIGGGEKDRNVDIGHKGIGKLAGLRFCGTFIVRSKQYGSNVGHILSWDAKRMMDDLDANPERAKKTPYKEFIRNYTEITSHEDDDPSSHYTQVQLIDIRDEIASRINEKSIIKFIKMNCPVAFYNDGFQYSKIITDWLGGNFSFVSTYVNEDKVIYQAYRDSHDLVKPEVRDVKYGGKLRAKVWFSWVKNSSEVISDPEITGMKFRCKGICVGDKYLFSNNCMPPGREGFSNWFTGEIVLLDDEILPNAARDRFIEGEKLKTLYKELKNTIGKELSNIAGVRSNISAARQELEKYNNPKEKKKDVLYSNLEGRLKELRKDKEKYGDKYSLDFSIIDDIEIIKAPNVSIAAKPKLKDIKKEVQAAIKNNDIDKMFQTDKAISEAIGASVTKTEKQEYAKEQDVIREHIQNIVKESSEDKRDLIAQICLKIIKKILDYKQVEYNEAELKVLVTSECLDEPSI